ncbi:sugar ABC transporter ATP-binding protein [Rhodopseudomonas palustris]|uniref:sugar ABC transporter ATP-binding protein n=1 Tax=Rhodopseudomonas palustris TaxID=1076 RepID=UPI002ACE11A9|nr:sugar ABC transporter ATP-binding protein [Rhodopseudomonas palustris]WQH00333.1 sugar ABC transporter ATP-binding protein [Rhodopseudomonas palustris]
MTMPVQAREVVVARGVSVSFGATKALRDVSIIGHAGSIHAVTGENGAGKSTLMKVLAGVYQPDHGEVEIDGHRVRLSGPRDALKHGISTVFQEFTLLPNLSVAENLFLGREPRRLMMVRYTQMMRDAEALLQRIGIDLDPERPVSELSIGEQQLVEIGKGVSANASVFIFDEPTAALNKVEVDKLGQLMLQLQKEGKAIFYISHRLEEIARWCDTVTVLKDGEHVLTRPTREMTPNALVTAMVGRSIQDLFPPRATGFGATLLQARGLQTRADRSPVDLTLRRGEILGIAGLEGQGQREVMRCLAGVTPLVAGEVRKAAADRDELEAVDLALGRTENVRRGIGFVPEDRKTEGLFLDLPISENLSLGILAIQRALSRVRIKRDLLKALAKSLHLAATGLSQAVGSLSGGNQQKVLLGRWLTAGSNVLLIEEPTRGVDVGAKTEIYRLLRDFAAKGGGVLLTSSELMELIGLCDRILVIRNGAFVGELDGRLASEEAILNLALPGGNPAHQAA